MGRTPSGGARILNSNAGLVDARTFGDTSQGHGLFFAWKTQWFHVWCEFLSQNNTGKAVAKPGYDRWRDTWMTYTHYRANGELVDDWRFLDLYGATGVGQYSAAWPLIEAEWFMSAAACEKIQIHTAHSNGSFAVLFAKSSSALTFPNVAGLPQAGPSA